MLNRKSELLAPAGSWQCFYAAIESGADSVYAGLKSLNARELAPNFNLEEMAALVQYAHKQGVKVYVALNSLVKENEIKDLLYLLCALSEIGPDALIIQDIGTWFVCRKFFPKLSLHASTLMGFHNSLGLLQAQDMGFERVVLARELCLSELKSCARKTNVELEIFVAGAMCFSISGLCMMSSFLGGKSSTRGRCVQPCRRRYNYRDSSGYFFSMKDLCLLDYIPDLLNIGIRCFKIEGRLRPAHYVASMVKAFRLVLDSPGSSDALESAKVLAKEALGRPMSNGYIRSSSPRGIIDPGIAPNTGLFVGRVSNVVDASSTSIWATIPVNKGDKLRLVDKKRGIQGSFTVKDVSGPDTDTYPATLLLELSGPARSSFDVSQGMLVFKVDSASLSSSKRSRPSLSSKWIKKILKKSRADSEEIYLRLFGRDRQGKNGDVLSRNVCAKVKNPNQVKLAKKLCNGLLWVDIPLKQKQFVHLQRYVGKGIPPNKVIWTLPPFIAEESIDTYRKYVKILSRQGYKNFAVSNIGQISFLKRMRSSISCTYHLNVANSLSVMAAKSLGIRNIEFSIETDLENLDSTLQHIPRDVSVFLSVFGYIPLFISRIQQVVKPGPYPLISPKGERFYWQLYNNLGVAIPDQPLNLINKFQRRTDALPITWITDLRFSPPSRRLPRCKQQRLQSLPGKDTWNLFSHWS